MKIKSFHIIVLTFVLFSCNRKTHQPQQTNPLSQNTPMEKQPVSTDEQYRKDQDKFLSGIDFSASGTEPFWSLEIDFNKMMHFKTVAGVDITAQVPEGVKAMDANVTRYRVQTGQEELIVQLAQQECVNSMSGQKSAYTVSVDVKKNPDNNYTNYKGCGNYTADYRINDIWVLESINTSALKKADFSKGLPQLEFNLVQKKLFGHTGCNNFNGALEVQGKKIKFGMLMTTRMACPNMDFEMAYLNSLQRRTVPYKIEPGKLLLQVSVDTVYNFRKVD